MTKSREKRVCLVTSTKEALNGKPSSFDVIPLNNEDNFITTR